MPSTSSRSTRLAAIYRCLAEPLTRRQTALPPGPLRIALLYLTAIGTAEVVTVLSPRLGMALHGLLLLLLLAHGSVVSNEAERAFLWGFALAPLIRLSSLSLPLLELPPLYWYPIISLPIFAATIVAARTMGYSWRHLGLTVTARGLIAVGPLVLAGIVLGLGEYLILRPEPLSRELTLSSLWLPALILSVLTGFQEELLFRGLLQRAATGALGGQVGLIVVSLLFAALHIGYWSLADLVFVFAVGYAFALAARWSGSILAPTFCHAAVNVSMFAIWPFLLPTLVVSR